MDAPAMLTRKHVPENIAEEGGQQQMHRDEKQHKPVLKKVKDKVKKIKNSIAGHGHDHDHGQDTGGSNSTEEDEDDAAMREAEVEKGGYQEDVEDKTVFSESSPELHGAPMYDSERIPAAAKDVKHNDAPGVRPGDLGAPAAAHEVKRDDAAGMRLGDFGGPAAAHEPRRHDTQGELPRDFGVPASGKEVKRDDTPGVRLGDLGGPVVEDPAAPNSRTPMPRGGEDIGTTDVVRDFEAMTVSDDPKQVGAGKMDVDVSKEYEAMPVSDGTGEEWNDAPTDAEYTGSYTDRLKNTAAGTTEYGKKLASTVYEKVAGVGTVVASKAQQVTPGFGAGGNAQDDSSATAAPDSMTARAGKRDLDLPNEGTPAFYTGTEELKNAATDATGSEGLKNAAADATMVGAPGATYTDKIKSAAAGTTEYSKKLASTVYEKVAGVGTAVASKAQQVMPSAGTATPGIGAQDGATTRATGTPGVGAQDGATTTATVTPGAGGPGNGQDKGVTGVTAYIAEKLRPGDEERSLSEAITGAVQERKEGVGSTVAKAREVPAQAVTRARGAVTSLTGGNRVSETVQPTTEGNIGGGVAAEGPVLHGEAPRTNTNVM
ncbi:low-temperature-induced 65 kDa protein-like isoform X2 [Hordeum vulgare subsp. vulgare]|uniref:low-temperature-induced 65 kDa protein-like isoform X2 n=1 Tax=Hordeum vulgare subsp. vulgare TaxID=112509 RepID=UPI000295CE28|nr:low-temperature-induced 65 kDa protein-like isoform X2 [Hordeum vulgare subsp. vulgare]